MTRTLTDRLWSRGLNPAMVKRSGANMVRSIVNPRSFDLMSDFRRAALEGRCSAHYARRYLKYAIKRHRELDARWRELGGRIP